MDNDLIQIWIDLPGMEMQETIQASFAGESLYQIEEIPFMTKEINYKDIVRCENKNDTPRLITAVIKPSGYKTVHIYFAENTSLGTVKSIIVSLMQKGITYTRSGTRTFSLNIPPRVDYQNIVEHIEQLHQNGVLENSDDREGVFAADQVDRCLKYLMGNRPDLENGLGEDEELEL